MTANEAASTLGISARQAPEQAILAELMERYPQISRRLWRTGVIKRLPEFGLGNEEREDVESIFREFPFLPDAFACYPEEKRIDIFEIEATSMMKRRKLEAYAAMMVELDFFGIDMQLLTMNQHRHMNTVDLWSHYERWLLSGVGQS